MAETDLNSLKFNISEIFYSIQGESTFAGMPCIFIRLQGCNYQCEWCDTKYAQDDKQKDNILNTKEILQEVKKYECNYICFTGGEPLMQDGTVKLLTHFCNEGYTVSLETNGHYSIKEIDARVIKIVDFKCPSSKMDNTNNFENIKYLNKNDEVKFLIADRNDFDWAKEVLNKYQIAGKVNAVLFSAVFKDLNPEKLTEWILLDNLPARLQLQLHKYIWDPNKKGV
ncbi:7-carboxy-7-deazaguanine synthase QueE [Bacteroidota bacterium]